MPISHAHASPAVPHWMPTAKATDIKAAPASPVFTASPGRPSALVAGANRICSVISGIAAQRIGTRPTVSSHFPPRKVSTSGAAVTASPK